MPTHASHLVCDRLCSGCLIYMNSILTTISQGRDYYNQHCKDAETKAQKDKTITSTKEKLTLANLHHSLIVQIQTTGRPNIFPQAMSVTIPLYFLMTHKARRWRTQASLWHARTFFTLKFLYGESSHTFYYVPKVREVARPRQWSMKLS